MEFCLHIRMRLRGVISGLFLKSLAYRPTLGPTQPPIQWVLGALSPVVKRPVREGDHSPPASAEVKSDRVLPPYPYASSWRGVQLIKRREFTDDIRMR
jgi:hypothetical protein